jgi:hypothetical protein
MGRFALGKNFECEMKRNERKKESVCMKTIDATALRS